MGKALEMLESTEKALNDFRDSGEWTYSEDNRLGMAQGGLVDATEHVRDARDLFAYEQAYESVKSAHAEVNAEQFNGPAAKIGRIMDHLAFVIAYGMEHDK